MTTTLLDEIQKLLVSMYEQTLAVPERIVLPARAFDPLVAELKARGEYRMEKREGAFGFWMVPGSHPAIELNTSDGSVVRIERGTPAWGLPT